MSAMDIRSITVKNFRYHSDKLKYHKFNNILKRNFSTTNIYQKWCTDITYIHTIKDRWTYLASVMDFHNKKIIGYSYDSCMNTDLAIEAIENACLNIKDTKGIILKSDLGTQYTSDKFKEFMNTKGIIHSFSRKLSTYDNAVLNLGITEKEFIVQLIA